MHHLKTLALYGLILCITCPVLFFVEHLYWSEEAIGQVGPIILTAIIFFAIHTLDVFITEWMHRTESPAIASYYLLMKGVRMFVLIALFIIYAVVCGKNLPLFSANLVVLFFITIAFSTIYYLKVESHRKKKETK